jgi:bla regulator protein blaR1
MLTERAKCRRSFLGKILLGLACVAVGPFAATPGAAWAYAMSGQATPPPAAKDLTGTWQGTLHAGRDLRTVVKITKDDKGAYKALFYSIDQTGQPMQVSSVTLDGAAVTLTLNGLGKYAGTLSADGNTIDGTWTQGPNPLPLVLTRTPADAAWAIPPPPQRMAADFNPVFEVATIKPSEPGRPGRAFLVRGRRFMTINTPLTAIICFAYSVQPKQIVGLPQWAEEDKFDIEAEPDGTGMPSDSQWKSMIQKLLADRFSLRFHHDKKEMPVYVLSVAKSGSKMTKDDADPNGLPGLFFRGLGKLNVHNATMTDFAGLMQSAVLDRPVLNQTELPGRYDFTLNWTPDESQFAPMGVRVPPPTDTANQDPPLYTAIEEQIGLKLEATRAPADVLVIDHVDHPSPN